MTHWRLMGSSRRTCDVFQIGTIQQKLGGSHYEWPHEERNYRALHHIRLQRVFQPHASVEIGDCAARGELQICGQLAVNPKAQARCRHSLGRLAAGYRYRRYILGYKPIVRSARPKNAADAAAALPSANRVFRPLEQGPPSVNTTKRKPVYDSSQI